MMSTVESPERVRDEGCKRLEMAPTLVEFVRSVAGDRLLRDTDDKRFEALADAAVPGVVEDAVL